MAPKKSKEKKKEEAADLVVAEVVEVEEEKVPETPDPYKGLRYTPLEHSFRPRRQSLQTSKIPVLKKKWSEHANRSTLHESPKVEKSIASVKDATSLLELTSDFTTPGMVSRTNSFFLIRDKQGAPTYSCLDPKLSKLPAPKLVHSYPLESPRRFLRMSQAQPVTSMTRCEENRRKESHSLMRYEMEKRKQMEMENYLMNATQKQRGHLLLRRGQIMPQVKPDGQERVFTCLKYCDPVPPIKMPTVTFFKLGDKGYQRNGLQVAFTKCRLGHNVITEWAGAPHATDYIVKLLGEAPVTEEDIVSLEEKQRELRPGRGCSAGDTNENHIPLFPSLGVNGVSYFDTEPESLGQRKPLTVDLRTRYLASIRYGQRSQRSTEMSKIALNVSEAQKEEDAEEEEDTRVALKFGDFSFYWCPRDRESTTERGRKTYIVEAGCTAELGKHSIFSTTLSSVGTVAVSYAWTLCDKTDEFNLKRYAHSRFALDCWGGVLLPGETARIPCMYKAKDMGYFTEDWRLETRPVLEGGASIILRMWGITRQDILENDKMSLIRNIPPQTNFTQTLVHFRVKKLIDYLPLKDVPLNDTRFPLVHLGPDIFHIENPEFSYHSAHVYRLGMMIEVISDLLKKQHVDFEDHMSSSLNSADSQDSMGDLSSAMLVTDISVNSNMTVDYINKEHTHNVNAVEAATVTERHDPRGKVEENGREEEDEEGEHQEPASPQLSFEKVENDPFSDEKLPKNWARRIERLQALFRDLTDLNVLEGRFEKSEPISRRNTDAVQIEQNPRPDKHGVNSNFKVDTLRKKILQCDRLDIQESAFNIMCEEVSQICFRPHLPKDNWKEAMGYTHLCFSFDSFSDYATELKRKCCLGQNTQRESIRRREMERLKELSNQRYNESIEDVQPSYADKSHSEVDTKPSKDDKNFSNDAVVDPLDSPRANSQTSAVYMSVSEKLSFDNELSDILDPDCEMMEPRFVLTKERYQDQYYSRLHTQMYQLLSDFVDTMDKVWKSERVLKLDQSGFTRVTDIPRVLDPEDYLHLPEPPKSIRMVQKMAYVSENNKCLKTSAVKET